MEKVTKDMTIGEIIRLNPRNAEVLMNFGMGCVGCPSAQGETLEQAVQVHGIELGAILTALNALA